MKLAVSSFKTLCIVLAQLVCGSISPKRFVSKLPSATNHSQNRYLQAEKPTHSQAHFIFFVPQKIKRACLFPTLTHVHKIVKKRNMKE